MTQQQALDILKTGANVFLTGEPGSGKTYTVNKFVAWLREHGVEPAITASTGIASTHINGMTIHSWSGIGIKRELSEEELDNITQKEHVARRIRKTSVLIIDEVSMLSSDTLAMVDSVCRAVRHDIHPFGGLQVVLAGDFFQLPPVTRRSQTIANDTLFGDEESESVFAFSGTVWRDLNPIVCYLTEQHRQEDKDFLDILSSMRKGYVTDKHREMLESCNRNIDEDVPVLFPHNANVDKVNNAELAKLPGVVSAFAMDRQGPEVLTNALIRGCLSPETLSLKEGARVMFTKNNPNAGFVNGTIGTVVGFDSGQPAIETYDRGTIIVEAMEWAVEEAGKVRAKITQLPLRLAWAVTVHKSQGMSLDSARIDLSHAFEYGQGYVALSRVRSLERLILTGFNKRALEVHPEVLEKDEEFRERSKIAMNKFIDIPEKELSAMHENFLKSIGGRVAKLSKEEQNTARSVREDTAKATLTLLRDGKSIDDIAKIRSLKLGTIITHIDKLREAGHIVKGDVKHLSRGREMDIEMAFGAFSSLGTKRIAPIFSKLKGEVSYETLSLARVLFLIEQKSAT